MVLTNYINRSNYFSRQNWVLSAYLTLFNCFHNFHILGWAFCQLVVQYIVLGNLTPHKIPHSSWSYCIARRCNQNTFRWEAILWWKYQITDGFPLVEEVVIRTNSPLQRRLRWLGCGREDMCASQHPFQLRHVLTVFRLQASYGFPEINVAI